MRINSGAGGTVKKQLLMPAIENLQLFRVVPIPPAFYDFHS
jgi:hypothetical protein